MNQVTWAGPREIVDLNDCYFYHTMEIPGFGVVQGEWDLRGRERAYLGGVALDGKRVLEVGTASGHLCFAMERMGASVAAYDLSEAQEWDIVPYAGFDYEEHILQRKAHVRRTNNAFWLAHRAYQSKAQMAYGAVYDLPADIGGFDVCTLGSILLHLRDPFLALQRVAAHATEAVIVTDGMPTDAQRPGNRRYIEFMPVAAQYAPMDTWWRVYPELVEEWMRMLGFPKTTISFHSQLYTGKGEATLYTVVGRRA